MRLLILVDRLNWAYDAIAKAIVKFKKDDDLLIDILPIKGNIKEIKKKYKSYDRFLVVGWQTYGKLHFLPSKDTLVGVHGYHAWDNKKSLPKNEAIPDEKLITFLNQFRGVNAVSKRLFNLFKANGVKNIYCTQNGVDSDMFAPSTARPCKDFFVGYSGSKKHDWRKGVSEYILPAASKSKVIPRIAMLSTDSYVTVDKMPQFYHSLNCYICASSSEGFSLSVLEAASCGLPIISTKVSGSDELIVNNENGFLVDRNIDNIAEAILILKNNPEKCKLMGDNMRKTIVEKFCWSKKVSDWVDFIKR